MISMYSLVRPSGLPYATPWQPSITCGPDGPTPSRNRPPDNAFNVSKGRAIISAYERLRPLGEAEIQALPLLARGAALRFMLTRLVDWLNVPPGAKVAPKNPLEYRDKLRFHQRVRSAADYGLMR
jgi:homoserine kinase type II